jgi:tetratricopeptide (TPR) repeat protein
VYISPMPAVLPILLIFLALNQASSPAEHTTFKEIEKRAEAARSADHLNEAIALYSEGVRLRPSWPDGWWSLGSLLYEQDQFAEAQVAFGRFVKLQPDAGPAYAFLALCEYETRNDDGSLLHFQAWAKHGSPGTDALLDVAGYHWALLLTRQGQFTQALYLLAAKAKKLGATPLLTEAMGLASLRMANLPEEYPAAKRELVWLTGKAAIYSARDDFRRSEEYAARLALLYGSEPDVNYLIGTLLGFQGKFPEAGEQYKKELRISSQHVPAMIELALVQIQLSQPADALPWAEQAVTLDPKNARAHFALGKALLASDHIPESAHELEAAKQLAPESAPVRSALASAYRKLGRMQEAKHESEIFLSLNGKGESLAPPLEETPEPRKPEQPR